MERDNFKNTKTKLLTKEQKKSYENAIYIYIYIYIYMSLYRGYRGARHSLCNLK